MADGNHILKLIFQYDSLQKQLAPVIPQVSEKLVSELLATGSSAKSIGRVINKSPSYVRALASGSKTLTAAGIVRVVKFAAAERQKDDPAKD